MRTDAQDRDLELLAVHEGDAPPVEIVPAERWRDWMSATHERFANRCLPLLMANQAGWVLLNTVAFEAEWDGGDTTSAIAVEYPAGTAEERRIALSHFGYGVLTFLFGVTFRTSPGFNLLARGPANAPKDGIHPLDGLVETDWALVPFTMNWKFTRPGRVRFDAGEPFCQVVPQRRGELERFTARTHSLEHDDAVRTKVAAWHAARMMYRIGREITGAAGERNPQRVWFNDYFRGVAPTGEENGEHQTTLRLDPFRPL